MAVMAARPDRVLTAEAVALAAMVAPVVAALAAMVAVWQTAASWLQPTPSACA